MRCKHPLSNTVHFELPLAVCEQPMVGTKLLNGEQRVPVRVRRRSVRMGGSHVRVGRGSRGAVDEEESRLGGVGGNASQPRLWLLTLVFTITVFIVNLSWRGLAVPAQLVAPVSP
jgi:hypothetical protein